MANKVYTVIKNGEEIETLKTLTAAKKLADTEGAEVFADGKCVYSGAERTDVENNEVDSPVTDTSADAPVEARAPENTTEQEVAEQTIVTAEPVVAKKSVQPKTEDVATVRYRLKNLMNIRKKPSLTADIASIKPEGTVVRALGVEGDWLHLADDTFVLYNGGEFAEKVD